MDITYGGVVVGLPVTPVLLAKSWKQSFVSYTMLGQKTERAYLSLKQSKF